MASVAYTHTHTHTHTHTLADESDYKKPEAGVPGLITEVCTHIERAIGRGKRFEIFNQKFPNTVYDIVSDINCICMYLTNFDVPLVE